MHFYVLCISIHYLNCSVQHELNGDLDKQLSSKKAVKTLGFKLKRTKGTEKPANEDVFAQEDNKKDKEKCADDTKFSVCVASSRPYQEKLIDNEIRQQVLNKEKHLFDFLAIKFDSVLISDGVNDKVPATEIDIYIEHGISGSIFGYTIFKVKSAMHIKTVTDFIMACILSIHPNKVQEYEQKKKFHVGHDSCKRISLRYKRFEFQESYYKLKIKLRQILISK